MRQANLLVVLLVALVAAAVLIPDVRALAVDGFHGDTAQVRRDLDGLGAWAALVLVLAVIVHNVVPIPAELLNGAAGYAFGAAVGIPLCLAAWLASGLVGYAVAVAMGRPLAKRLVGEHRLTALEDAVAKGGARVLIVLRLIPLLPFTGISLVAGLAHVPVGRFSWTTVLGTAPLTIICVVLGARLQTPRLDDPLLIGSLIALIAIVLVAPVVGRRFGGQPAGSGS